jgi:FlaA1/EpsC-like NDP-sugar epimerase
VLKNLNPRILQNFCHILIKEVLSRPRILKELKEETITGANDRMIAENKQGYQYSFKRILLVGSWAKGQITIENLKTKNLNIKIFAYMSIKNPAIASSVDGYRIGDFGAIDDIVGYGKKQKIDLVIVTTAEPLSFGLADALEKENIKVFGPTKQAAQLEKDKAFTRELMKD